MTKSDLINTISESVDLSKKDIGNIIGECFKVITTTLSNGDKVQIVGFGTFEVRTRKERKGRNPSTGKEITIPKSTVPAFKAGRGLKDAVSKH